MYDLLEFVAGSAFLDAQELSLFKTACNKVMKQEMAGYQFIKNLIAPLATEAESAAVVDVLSATSAKKTSPLILVHNHIERALALLANRKSPDYRNAMKEAINAVECICKLVAKTPDATLSPALDAIQRSGRVKLHADLVARFKKLYHYSSDSDGIRHALKDEPTVDVEDAKFMLLSCAGFVSYVIAKAQKVGIVL